MSKYPQFYNSKAWRDLAYAQKVAAGGKCQRCKKDVMDWKHLIAHHRIELDDGNIHSPEITLNPNNIEIVCMDCHNREHKRFGYKGNVYIVYGPPCSGKSTWVHDNASYGDLVLDIDRLWEAISLQDKYTKPNSIRFNVFALRDELLRQIKLRYGQWHDAYIVGGYPDKYERERLEQELGATSVFIEATLEECMERAEKDGRPLVWREYIASWFDRYRG